MVFSSNAFLFFFLPIVLGFYFLFRKNRTAANTILTIFSLLFYAWGEPAFVFVMLASIFMNWLFALGIDHFRARRNTAKANTLKEMGYEGRVSVEAGCDDFSKDAREAFKVLNIHRA